MIDKYILGDKVETRKTKPNTDTEQKKSTLVLESDRSVAVLQQSHILKSSPHDTIIRSEISWENTKTP